MPEAGCRRGFARLVIIVIVIVVIVTIRIIPIIVILIVTITIKIPRIVVITIVTNNNGRFRECVGASLASKPAQGAFVTEVGPVFTSVAPHRNLACQDFGPHGPIIIVTIILITIIGIIVIVTVTILTVTILLILPTKSKLCSALVDRLPLDLPNLRHMVEKKPWAG